MAVWPNPQKYSLGMFKNIPNRPEKPIIKTMLQAIAEIIK
jgi:hypothetical protein